MPNIFIALADKYNNIVGNTNTASLSVDVSLSYNTNTP